MNNRFRVCATSFAFVMGLFFIDDYANALDDWTQWGGTNRNFTLESPKLGESLKLDEIWRRELGNGYSAVLAEENRLYTMYRKGDDEVIVAANAQDGKTVWEYKYNAPMKEGATTDFGKGPNSLDECESSATHL